MLENIILSKKEVMKSTGEKDLHKTMKSKELDEKGAIVDMISAKKSTLDYISWKAGGTDSKNLKGEDQLNELFELYSKINQQETYFQGYMQEAAKNNSWRVFRQDVSEIKGMGKQSLKDHVKSMTGRFISIRQDILTNIEKKIDSMNFFSIDVYNDAKSLLPHLQNMGKDGEENYNTYYKKKVDQAIRDKRYVDESITNINQWIETLIADGYSKKANDLIKFKNKLVGLEQIRNKDNVLSEVVAKGLAAEFTVFDGYIDKANKIIIQMEAMDSLLCKNLAEYNKNPTMYGAKTGKWLSTGEFTVSRSGNRGTIPMTPSQEIYSEHIEQFKQKYAELKKVEGVEDKVLRDSAELIGQLGSKMDNLMNDIVLYKNKMKKLENNKFSDVIDGVDFNQVSEKLASVISEKKQSASESAMTNNVQTDSMVLPIAPVKIHG